MNLKHQEHWQINPVLQKSNEEILRQSGKEGLVKYSSGKKIELYLRRSIIEAILEGFSNSLFYNISAEQYRTRRSTKISGIEELINFFRIYIFNFEGNDLPPQWSERTIRLLRNLIIKLIVVSEFDFFEGLRDFFNEHQSEEFFYLRINVHNHQDLTYSNQFNLEVWDNQFTFEDCD